MIDDPLLQVFFEEAVELLADSEEALLHLEKTPEDVPLLDRIFRCAHTLKSNSAMLGFMDISRCTHDLEDLLDHLRKKRRPVTSAVIDALLASHDLVRSLLSRIRSGTTPDSAKDAQAMARVLETLQFLSRNGDLSRADALSGDASSEQESKNPSNLIEQVNATMEVVVDQEGQAAQAELGSPDEKSLALPTSSVPSLPIASTPTSGSKQGRDDHSIRVALDKLDRLINLVGELVVTQSMVSLAVGKLATTEAAQLKEDVEQMDRHARELHERVMALAMVPLRRLFERFPRIVRDLAASLGKQAVLTVAGENTELDKNLIDKISDPLGHLLRNAVDHGLEATEDRLASGKSEIGTVRLEAFHQGGGIYIEVADDGRGLDVDRIVAQARANGMIEADRQPSEEESFDLIFRPGFSTASHITQLSGRGVGLDVVKRNIELLGGGITIHSQKGQGTCFRIRLPLTVAIMDTQAVRVGDQIYLLPMLSIVESVRPSPGSLHQLAESGEIVMLRDKALPLLRLHRLFDLKPGVVDPSQGLVAVVEHEGKRAALLLDEVLGQQQVVIKSLEANYRRIEGVAGATILGDGRVALILDVPELMHRGRSAGNPTLDDVA